MLNELSRSNAEHKKSGKGGRNDVKGGAYSICHREAPQLAAEKKVKWQLNSARVRAKLQLPNRTAALHFACRFRHWSSRAPSFALFVWARSPTFALVAHNLLVKFRSPGSGQFSVLQQAYPFSAHQFPSTETKFDLTTWVQLYTFSFGAQHSTYRISTFRCSNMRAHLLRWNLRVKFRCFDFRQMLVLKFAMPFCEI